MAIQWYPGHMKKALREINENIKLIDIVVEMLDARIPGASRNPDIDTVAAGKARVIVLSKADLADKSQTKLWEAHFKDLGFHCVAIDSRNRGFVKTVSAAIEAAGAKKRERDKARGILRRPVRALIAGIPNSGKSTFINSYVGKKSAKTGDKPGVTKGKQWIRLSKDVELLDSPGILWPRFEDEKTGVFLAICGSIKDEILKRQELALALFKILDEHYPGTVNEAYGASDLYGIAVNKSLLLPGGEPDVSRAADMAIRDFRQGRLGHITLEHLEEV